MCLRHYKWLMIALSAVLVIVLEATKSYAQNTGKTISAFQEFLGTRCFSRIIDGLPNVTSGLRQLDEGRSTRILQSRAGSVWYPDLYGIVLVLEDRPICRVLALNVDTAQLRQAIETDIQNAGRGLKLVSRQSLPDGSEQTTYQAPLANGDFLKVNFFNRKETRSGQVQAMASVARVQPK